MKNKKPDILLIRNGRVLLANGGIIRADVLIERGRIKKIGRSGTGGRKQVPDINAAGCYVLPGFIDIHTHGIGYESLYRSLKAYAELETARGTTTFYPTFFSSPDIACELMRRHLRETRNLKDTPQIGGFRLEAPYLAKSGGGLDADLSNISKETTNRLIKAGGGHIKIWDVSPELPHAKETIRFLSSRRIICSLAHTNASLEQAKTAVNAGARLVTHMFDTFALPKETDSGVYPAGLIDYLLLEDRVACEIIADGTHVHPLLVEKTMRCKPAEKIIFITDSYFGAGLPPGKYVLPNTMEKLRINGPNNGVRLIDRNMGLTGSALTPLDAFRNALRMFGQDIATAARLCSRNPAVLLDLNKGEIAVGRDADLVVLTPELALTHTIVKGKILYENPAR